MKKGSRIRLLGLPVGQGLSRKLIGRTGKIISKWNPGKPFNITFYNIRLDKLPRERTVKEISGLSKDKLELIKNEH